MSTRFAINGVGRIGRALVRVASQRPDLELVALNDLAPVDQLAPLLARDTLHGPFPATITVSDGSLLISGDEVGVFQESDPAAVGWGDRAPNIVVDATGLAKTRQGAGLLRRDAVEKGIVSAKAKDLDLTLCLGINQGDYDHQNHHLLSAASGTTNCRAPMVSVLDREFGLEHGIFNTVHSYNNDQRLLSHPHPDPRRAREAALNMIPTTTSASHAIHEILPDLKGRLDGFAIRVPTPNVSLIDLVAVLSAKPSVADVNAVFAEAAAEELDRVLAVTDAELISSDFLGDPHSAIVDLPLTRNVEQNLVRVDAWYDNEWGYSNRVLDLILHMEANKPI